MHIVAKLVVIIGYFFPQRRYWRLLIWIMFLKNYTTLYIYDVLCKYNIFICAKLSFVCYSKMFLMNLDIKTHP